jgi:hypothetical protein
MAEHHGAAHDGLCDLPLLVLVTAVVLGLGSVAAGLSRPGHDSQRDVAVVTTPQRTVVGASSLTTNGSTSGRPHDEATEMSAFTSPAARRRRHTAVPADLSSTGVGDDDPRSFLIHMMDVLYGRGQPLPADVGRLQSLVNSLTPTAMTAPYRDDRTVAPIDVSSRKEDALFSLDADSGPSPAGSG